MDGRISMAGINGGNVGRLADAIVDALRAAPSAKL
jgi:aspartate/tyrosine/aromatic aminotransferase